MSCGHGSTGILGRLGGSDEDPVIAGRDPASGRVDHHHDRRPAGRAQCGQGAELPGHAPAPQSPRRSTSPSGRHAIPRFRIRWRRGCSTPTAGRWPGTCRAVRRTSNGSSPRRARSGRATPDLRPAFAGYRETLLGRPGRDRRAGRAVLAARRRGELRASWSATTRRPPARPPELHQLGLDLIAGLREEYAEIGSRLWGTSDVPEIFQRLRTELLWDNEDEMVARRARRPIVAGGGRGAEVVRPACRWRAARCSVVPEAGPRQRADRVLRRRGAGRLAVPAPTS